MRKLFRLIVRWIFGHKYDCCSHITERCKKCPFHPDEVKKIMQLQNKKEAKNGK